MSRLLPSERTSLDAMRRVLRGWDDLKKVEVQGSAGRWTMAEYQLTRDQAFLLADAIEEVLRG